MIIDDLPFVMFECLIITIIIETITGLIIGIREKKDIFNIVLVNIMTNPLVVSAPIYFYIKYGTEIRMFSLIILEVITFLLEGLIYKKYLEFRKINGYIVSLILNIASFSIGEIIYFLSN